MVVSKIFTVTCSPLPGYNLSDRNIFLDAWNHQLEWWLTSRGCVVFQQFDQSIDLAANTGARCWVPAKEKPATNWPHFMTWRPGEITKKTKKNKFSSNLHVWGVKSSETAISTIKYPYPYPDPMGWEYLTTAISPCSCGHFSPTAEESRQPRVRIHEQAVDGFWLGGFFPRGVFFGCFKYVLNQNRPEIIENPLPTSKLLRKILIHEVIPSFSTNVYRPKRLRSPRRWRWRESWQKSLQIFDFGEFQVNAQNQVSSCWIHLCSKWTLLLHNIRLWWIIRGAGNWRICHPVFFWSVFCGP